jgi:hypothetical protein
MQNTEYFSVTLKYIFQIELYTCGVTPVWLPGMEKIFVYQKEKLL